MRRSMDCDDEEAWEVDCDDEAEKPQEMERNRTSTDT